MTQPNTTMTPASSEMESLDALLADLDALGMDETVEAEVEIVIEEGTAPEADEIVEIGEDEESELAGAIAKDEIYAETESASEIAETEPVAVKPTKEKMERKPRAAKGPRIERSLEALPAQAFLVVKGAAASEEAKAEIIAARPTQKKIAEKFDQTIAALHAGRKPSTYVVDCFTLLHKAPSKSMTSSELIAGLKATDYAEDTASSQVGQIMVLFPILGMATRVKQTITLREDSVFNEKLAALIA